MIPPLTASRVAACPLCGSGDVCEHIAIREYTVLRCRECTHQFVESVTEEVLAESYGRDYYQGAAYDEYVGTLDKRIADFRWQVKAIEALTNRGRVLDVGCAVGAFVKAARDAGWD